MSTGYWRTLQSGITTKSIKTSGARAGRTYKFKVEARNVIGYSQTSEEFAIKAAIVPTQPRSLTLNRQLPFSYRVGDLLTARVDAYNGIGVSPSKESN